ncbi:hypothetical protein [Paenibacillus soyae]|uniref:AAA domain-containing protein n=1 Tax=Paenibacillus soyae TaxID=2969249 RepID=A0A9X2S930_9BACL|nr:hypothetical protein [Paenibacillus soyae]MCR2802342.1 hypothetical protein [Paenibacillus soyae]
MRTSRGGVVLKRFQLAVVAKEKEYTRRLADYIRGSAFGERWQVAAFTHPGACKQYAKQGYAIDLIAAESELLRELRPELSAVPSVALVSKPGEGGGDAELMQFQALPVLLKGLAEQFGRLSGRMGDSPPRSEGAGTRIVTIHSATGGVGKTTLALHLSNAAAARGQKTFYLNMERWDTSGLWLHALEPAGELGDGLSELLYELKTGEPDSTKWIAGRRRYHPLLKCDYIAGFRNAEDRLSLEADDAIAIVEAIAGGGQYDLVIVDLDENMTELHAALLAYADRNLWVVNDEPSCAAKQSSLLRFGQQKWGERFSAIMARSLIVRNRSEGNREKAQTAFGVAHAPVPLPDAPEWRRGEHHPLLSSSSYRAAVDQLYTYALGEREAAHAVG